MARNLEGKLFLITGATEGIGKAAALDFARRGAALVVVGRNKEKTERVVSELKQASGTDAVEMLLGDMSKIADIRSVAQAFRAKHDRLDVLVNNAGAVFSDYKLSADGFEMTFALNHIAYFLLTHEVLDLLKKTPGSRVVSTSSGAHMGGKMNLDDIAKPASGSSGFGTYCNSKLANVLFTRELAKRLAGSGAVANCFHPGFVQSGFGQNNEGFMAGAIKLGAMLFARTPEKGAETLIWLATSPEAAKFNGEYFHDKKVSKIQKLAKDDGLAAGLWTLSDKLCGTA